MPPSSEAVCRPGVKPGVPACPTVLPLMQRKASDAADRCRGVRLSARTRRHVAVKNQPHTEPEPHTGPQPSLEAETARQPTVTGVLAGLSVRIDCAPGCAAENELQLQESGGATRQRRGCRTSTPGFGTGCVPPTRRLENGWYTGIGEPPSRHDGAATQ